MDLESMLMGVINNNLTKKVVRSSQNAEREDRGVPNSTRRAFESRMKSDAAVARMASQNMEDAKGMVTVAQTNITAIKSQFQAIQEILTNCAYTDSLTQSFIDSSKASIIDHVKEIQRLAGNAEFNGMKLMDGSAGNNGTIELQAGNSVRNQTFQNLLDTSLGGTTVIGNTSMSVNNLLSSSGNLLNTELDFSDQSGARTALGKVEKYIERMQGLEGQYSYDYKSLDNLSILFEEQADIYEQTAERSTPSSSSGNASTNSANILAQLLSAGGSSILSGST